MADNDQISDEYNFEELDGMDNNMLGDAPLEGTEAVTTNPSSSNKKDVKRNAIIAVVLVIFVMLFYKIISVALVDEKNKSTTALPALPVASQSEEPLPQTVQVQPTITPTQPVQALESVQPVTMENNSALTQKISDIELSQQNVRSDVSSVSQQVGAVSNNINSLNSQIANLNQVITNLSNQMVKQSEEINILMARTQPKRVPVKARTHNGAPNLVYHIQAVIPGRAWLIASNGSTLTVREGTVLAGYGVVKLIDSMQGQVIMSSGHIIRFSQEDS